MESQPTIITTEEPRPTTVEKANPELPQEPATERIDSTEQEASIRLMPDLARIFEGSIFKNLNSVVPPCSSEGPPKEKEEATDSKPQEKVSFDLPEIMNLVKPYIPMLAGLLSTRSSDIPARGSKVPTFHRQKSKDTSLLVQIIIGKFSFIVTRTGEDKYTVAFKRETIFQKKIVSAKGLYKLLKTLTGVLDKRVHFELLSKGVTLENKVIEPMDISKKALKTHIRYFLCLI